MRDATPNLPTPVQLDSAELVIKMQRRRLDGDLGNRGWMRREASAERVEIGQSSGIELGIDGLGELDFTGTIMSQRQQPTIVWQACFSPSPTSSASKARRSSRFAAELFREDKSKLAASAKHVDHPSFVRQKDCPAGPVSGG